MGEGFLGWNLLFLEERVRRLERRVLHNMRVHYRLPLEIEENIIFDDAHAHHANGIEEEQDVILRRGPRAIAQRVQKQIMRDWFPNYRCAWDNENNE